MLRKVDAIFMHRYLIIDRGFTGLKSLNYLNSYVSHTLYFNLKLEQEQEQEQEQVQVQVLEQVQMQKTYIFI